MRATVVFLAALTVAACGSKNEMRDPIQDASNTQGTPKADAASDQLDGSQGKPNAGDARNDNGERDAARTNGGDGASPDARSQSSADGAVVTPAPEDLETLVYVGGYGSAYPVRVYALDRTTFALTRKGESTDLGASPAYIAASKDGRYLYLANEDDAASGITVAKVDDATGLLSKLEREPYSGKGLVYTSVDPSGAFVLAADYNGSTAQVYRAEADGKLSAAVDTKTFPSGAHSHAIRVHPSGKWAYVPNKDANPASVAQFSFDAQSGKLTALTPATVRADGGPRHLAFHPSGDFVYILTEYTAMVRAYGVDGQGTLTEFDSKSSLPTNYSGLKNTAAHVLVHPNGKYLYASNRGHDQIAVFSLATDGKLSFVEHTPTGKTPRDFDIDSKGELLVSAGQDDGSLTVYSIGGDGRLTKRGTPVTGLTNPAAVLILNRVKR